MTATASFYSTVLIMVLALETSAAAPFLIPAVMGLKKNLWVVAAPLGGHGIFDFFHHIFIQNPGVPVWSSGFCLSFDVVAAIYMAVLLLRRSGFPPPAEDAADRADISQRTL